MHKRRRGTLRRHGFALWQRCAAIAAGPMRAFRVGAQVPEREYLRDAYRCGVPENRGHHHRVAITPATLHYARAAALCAGGASYHASRSEAGCRGEGSVAWATAGVVAGDGART